jgi:hypothetical protein
MLKKFFTLVLFSNLFFASLVQAADRFNPINNQLTIPQVVVGDTVYTNVVITVAAVISVNGGVPVNNFDTFNAQNNQLSIPLVYVGDVEYTNVVINVGEILQVGGASKEPPSPVYVATLYDTSYKNFKLNGADSIKYTMYPWGVYNLRWGVNPETIGFGDFLKAGELSVFVAYQNYIHAEPYSLVQNNPSSYASLYVFYAVNADKSLSKSISFKGCLQPRKAVVADFNKDGIPDVFVSCTGYDNPPFPGEKSQLILSSGRGNYTVTDVGDIGFTHGASAADINGDGYPDIAFTGGGTIHFYINQKNGSFVKDTSRVKSNIPYFNVELVDVDGDGKVDILGGGHEFEGSTTKIIYADPDGTYGSRFTNIPSVQTKGVVNDFTFVGNTLYVNRTTDRTSSLGWYNGLTIQSYNLNTGISNVVSDVSGNWIPWLLPKTKNKTNGVGPFNSEAFFQ